MIDGFIEQHGYSFKLLSMDTVTLAIALLLTIRRGCVRYGRYMVDALSTKYHSVRSILHWLRRASNRFHKQSKASWVIKLLHILLAEKATDMYNVDWQIKSAMFVIGHILTCGGVSRHICVYVHMMVHIFCIIYSILS